MNFEEIREHYLGHDFISPTEVSEAKFGVTYTQADIEVLLLTLPGEATLSRCAEDGFCLLPQPPKRISLLDLLEMCPLSFVRDCRNNGLLEEEFAASETTGKYWLAVKKTMVSHSPGHSWRQQRGMILAHERIPSAVELAWFIAVFGLLRKVSAFSRASVRVSSAGSLGHIGVTRVGGLISMSLAPDEDCSPVLGLSVAKLT